MSGIALIHEGDLQHAASDLLCFPAQVKDLCPILFMRWGRHQGDEVAQRIDDQVNFGALAPLGSVIPGTMAALWRALQGSTVDDDRGGFPTALLLHTGEQAQVMHGVFEAVGSEPALSLRSHDLRRRKVMR